jgi:hypothetical protein
MTSTPLQDPESRMTLVSRSETRSGKHGKPCQNYSLGSTVKPGSSSIAPKDTRPHFPSFEYHPSYQARWSYMLQQAGTDAGSDRLRLLHGVDSCVDSGILVQILEVSKCAASSLSWATRRAFGHSQIHRRTGTGHRRAHLLTIRMFHAIQGYVVAVVSPGRLCELGLQ